jgi:hypothetical protein
VGAFSVRHGRKQLGGECGVGGNRDRTRTKDTIVTAGQQLFEQGRKQGIEQGIARSLVDVYEARFGAMPEAIRVVIEATHDEPTLRAWLKLAGTRGADEIAAAIHAVRAS